MNKKIKSLKVSIAEILAENLREQGEILSPMEISSLIISYRIILIICFINATAINDDMLKVLLQLMMKMSPDLCQLFSDRMDWVPAKYSS